MASSSASSIAGADGVWHAANAIIKDNTVLMSSPDVAAPRKVSYACWQNPEGCNLYNKDGLPAAPFHVEDVTKRYTIAATAGHGGTITPPGGAKFPHRENDRALHDQTKVRLLHR